MDFLGALCDGVRIVMDWVGNSQEGSLQPSHILILMQGSRNCAILRSRIGESGEFWEKVRESERE